MAAKGSVVAGHGHGGSGNRKRRRGRGRAIGGRILFSLALAAVLAGVLIPYMWMVSGSFKSSIELQASDVTRPGLEPSWIPRQPTLDNYRNVNRT
ncbi:MAG: hypothetical protein LOD91_05225, partial [Limnochordales bacterium]